MTEANKSPEQHRRSTDLASVEKLTSWDLLRRHLIVGSWFGHLLFILYGILYGASYGVVGGIGFFKDMYLLDQLGTFNTFMGIVCGAFIGLVCVWAICAILGSVVGSMVYWFKYRSFPMTQMRD